MSSYFPLRTMLWVLFVLQFMFCYMACGCSVKERVALMRIRPSFVEADEHLASWGQSDDCCSWERVTCNNSTRAVLDLKLNDMYPANYDITCRSLDLSIFSEFHELRLLDLASWSGAIFDRVIVSGACLQNFSGLQGLTKLRYLNLSGNTLIGNNILESLGKLPSLEVINLDQTNISGALQNIAFRDLKNLRELRLRSNRLNGSIPASLFRLQHLEYLDLSKNLLQGHIPISSSLNLLSSLQILKLSENNLNGTFDLFFLRNCSKLKAIVLSGNSDLVIDVTFRRLVPPFQLAELVLSGCNLDNSIIAGPNFLGTQHQLQVLDLSNNSLTGSIPTWILENRALFYLNLAKNSLVGSLDLIWRHQYNLGVMNISMNRFVGKLPTNISSVFPYLEVLDASYNNISGDLPPSLCKIESLEFIDLSNNKLTGKMPTCLFTSPLLMLKLSNNNIGGPILGGASSLCAVKQIYLASNNFEGELPNNLSGDLRLMDLHDNKLSGKLDVSSWNLSSLQVLSVASNSLTGEIYPAICNLTGLQFLDMSDNNFIGSVPNCGSKLTLKFLNMSKNTVSGFLNVFLNSSYAVALDIRYNQFNGSLDWIQYLSQIKMLFLGGNRFEGKISPNLCHLQHLNIIDLSHNKLWGSLPSCIGSISFGNHEDDLNVWSSDNLVYSFGLNIPSTDYGLSYGFDYGLPSFNSLSIYDLQGFTFFTKWSLYIYGRNFFNLMSGIDLSANMLSGEIPSEIGNLSHVRSLNLSHNSFTGPIPATMANMRAIESLDLSHNELSGSIPSQMTQMSSLEVFSVAYNNLTGCIPNSGQLGLFGAESYLANTNLHNMSKGNLCFPVPVPIEEEHVGEESDDPILYIISAASYVVSFWATTAFLFCHPFGQRVVLQI